MEVNKDWSVVKLSKLYDPTEFIEPAAWERGHFSYGGPGNVLITQDEPQVAGSFARYNHPKYKEMFYHVKKVVENVIGEKVYPSYYYDRFYFKGQVLKKHKDRPCCEISVSYHISGNLDYDWPIHFETDDGQRASITCLPGDGVLYRGYDLWHWREPMQGNHKSYFHQIFFHYVRANGKFIQHAGDHFK
jgi:hypothetical protein